MSFKGMLISDMESVFTNPKEFGEVVVLIRNGVELSMSALYDEPALDGSAIGAEVEAISHRPRLFVSSANLPDGKPKKGDKFRISKSEFHAAGVFVAREFTFEKDGSVTYELQAV